jgi:hypothetical protein
MLRAIVSMDGMGSIRPEFKALNPAAPIPYRNHDAPMAGAR